MTRDEIVQGRLECAHIQAAFEPPRQRIVIVPRLRIEPMQEPEPLLRERQRQRGRPRRRLQARSRRLRVGERARHARHGGRVEQRPHRHVTQQRHANATEEPCRHQRMAAEHEEVVVQPHPLGAQHLGEERAQHAFDGRSRSAIHGGGRRGRVRGWQRSPIDFSLRRERHRGDDDDSGRHHVVRQMPCGMLPDDRGLHHRLRCRDHVGHESRLVRARLIGDHHRVAHTGHGTQRSADLAELDAEASNLDLFVRPADEGECPLRRPPSQVTAAVHPRPRGAVRVGDKSFRRQPGTLQISTRDAGAGDVHLPVDADRQRLQLWVQHVDTEARQADADRTVRRRRHLGRDLQVGDMHRRLGDAVHVAEHGGVGGMPLEPRAEAPDVQRFATEDDIAQRQRRRFVGSLALGRHQLVESGGCLIEHRHALGNEHVQELAR